MDIGTGDGRAVLRRAAADPRALVVGIDAAASAMIDASRRADRRGPANAVFFAAGAEALVATPLAAHANLVTVLFPWGSLVRGIVGLDDAALCGVASLLAPDGRLEVAGSGSTWARRLRAGGDHRPVWRLEGMRSASIDR